MQNLRTSTASLVLPIYCGLLLLGTHWPGQVTYAGFRWGELGFDKLQHFGAYLLLTWLATAHLRHVKGVHVSTFALILGLATFGFLDEFTQALVSRAPELADWAADLAGISLGTVTFQALQLARGPGEWSVVRRLSTV